MSEVARNDPSQSFGDSSMRTFGLQRAPFVCMTRVAFPNRHASRASISASPTFTAASRNG